MLDGVRDGNQFFRESGLRRPVRITKRFVLVLCTWVHHVYFTEMLLPHVKLQDLLSVSGAKWSSCHTVMGGLWGICCLSGFHGIWWFLLQWAPVFNMKPQEGSKVQRIWNTSLILKYFRASTGESGGCAVREHEVQQNTFPFIIFEAPVFQRACRGSGLLLSLCSLIAVF